MGPLLQPQTNWNLSMYKQSRPLTNALTSTVETRYALVIMSNYNLHFHTYVITFPFPNLEADLANLS